MKTYASAVFMRRMLLFLVLNAFVLNGISSSVILFVAIARPHSSLDAATPDQAYFNPLPLRMAA